MVRERVTNESASAPALVQRSNSAVRTPITVAPPDVVLVAAPRLIGTDKQKADKLAELNAKEIKKPASAQVIYVKPESLPPQRTAKDGAAWVPPVLEDNVPPRVRAKAAELVPAPTNKVQVSEKVENIIAAQEEQTEFKINPLLIFGIIGAVLIFIFLKGRK